jgi:hypothetical protein
MSEVRGARLLVRLCLRLLFIRESTDISSTIRSCATSPLSLLIFYHTKPSIQKTSLFPNPAKMAINYEEQCHNLFTLYEQNKLAECLQQGQLSLRDLPMPSYWRIKTWYILAGAESGWKKAEVSYQTVQKEARQQPRTHY